MPASDTRSCEPASGLPAIFVVGAGGFGAEIVDYLQHVLDRAATPAYAIAGVVDDHVAGPPPEQVGGVPFRGRIADVADTPSARFVVAAGAPRFRRETIEQLRALGLPLHTLVHPTALVSASAQVGEGSVIAPFSIVNANARVGAGCVLNVYCSVGHDAVLGDFSVLSPYAAMNGWSSVGAQSFLGTRATVFPRVKVGERCTIDSHSYAKADTGDRMIISARGEYRVLSNRLEK